VRNLYIPTIPFSWVNRSFLQNWRHIPQLYHGSWGWWRSEEWWQLNCTLLSISFTLNPAWATFLPCSNLRQKDVICRAGLTQTMYMYRDMILTQRAGSHVNWIAHQVLSVHMVTLKTYVLGQNIRSTEKKILSLPSTQHSDLCNWLHRKHFICSQLPAGELCFFVRLEGFGHSCHSVCLPQHLGLKTKNGHITRNLLDRW